MDFLASASDSIFSTIAGQSSARESVSAAAMNRGAGYLQKGDYARAVVEFRRATAFSTESIDAHHYLAKACVLAKRPEEAVASYRKAIELDAAADPTSTVIRSELAQYLVTLERYEEAEEEYNKITRLSPSSAGPAASLGHIYLRTGRVSAAELQFRKVVQMAPGDAAAHYSMGLVYNEQERYNEAVCEFSTALRLRPDYAMARADLATSYIGLDRDDDAQLQADALYSLNTEESIALAQEIELELFTPRIIYSDPLASTFNSRLGPGTTLDRLDPSLATPGAIKTFSFSLSFNQPMDASSVQNVFNWTISRSTGGQGGLYNSGMASHGTNEVSILPIPTSVTYDPETYRVTIDFKIMQNADGTGVIDPSHIVFRFRGLSADGLPMDTAGDEYDGARGIF